MRRYIFVSRASAARRGTSDSYTAFRRLAGARPALVDTLLRRGMGAVVNYASLFSRNRDFVAVRGLAL